MKGDSEIPVAVVSKSYQLIQHRQVIESIITALEHVGIDSNTLQSELSITQYGERIGLHIQFPSEYSFDPGDGHEMALRLGVFNSVDGSTRFGAVLGWLRFVCSNGMIVGSAQTDYKRRHNQTLILSDIKVLLTHGIQLAVADQENLERWNKAAISREQITHWTDSHVAKRWGIIAATKAFHISMSGIDVDVKPFSKQVLPSQKAVIVGNAVPGSTNPAQSVYDVYQVLSWLAGQRHCIEQQLKWQHDIPELMAALIR